MLELGEIRTKLIADASGFKKGTAEARNELGQFTKSTDAAGSKLAGFEKTLSRTGAAVGVLALGIGVATVKVAGDFQQSIATAGAKANATASELEDMARAAKQAGIDSAYSAKEAADSLGLLAQSGMTVNEQISTLPGLLDLAAAGAVDLGVASDIAIGSLKGFGFEVDQIGRVGDVLAKAANLANTSMEGLGSGLSYVAPTAAALGVSFEETAGALGMLANAGIKGSRAGTSLNGMLAKMTAASEKLGANLTIADIETLGLAGSFDKLVEHGLNGKNAMELFGQEAGPGVAALLGQGTDALRTMTEELENAGGTAKEIAEKQLNTMNGQIKLLMGSVETLAISLGETLTPVIQSVSSELIKQVNALTQSEEGMESLAASTKTGVNKMADAFEGFAPLITIGAVGIGVFVDGIKTLDIVATTAAVGLGKLWEMMLERTASAGNPEAVKRLRDFQVKLAASTEDLSRKVDDWGKSTMAGADAGERLTSGIKAVTAAAREGAKNIGVLGEKAKESTNSLEGFVGPMLLVGPTMEQAGLTADDLAKRVNDVGDAFDKGKSKAKGWAESLREVEVAAQRAAAASKVETDEFVMGVVDDVKANSVFGKEEAARAEQAAIDNFTTGDFGTTPTAAQTTYGSAGGSGAEQAALAAAAAAATGGMSLLADAALDAVRSTEGYAQVQEKLGQAQAKLGEIVGPSLEHLARLLDPVLDILDALSPLLHLVYLALHPVHLALKPLADAAWRLAEPIEWLETAIKNVIVWFANLTRREANHASVVDGKIVDPLGKLGGSGNGVSAVDEANRWAGTDYRPAAVDGVVISMTSLADAADTVTDSLTTVSESLLNVPTIFNAQAARTRASRTQGFTPDRSTWAGEIGEATGGSALATATGAGGVGVYVDGDVYVEARDPESFSDRLQRRTYARTGARGAQQSNLSFSLQTAG